MHATDFLSWCKTTEYSIVESMTTTLPLQQGGLGLARMDLQTRVNKGRAVEDKIKIALAQQHGVNIAPANDSQDLFQKIDGFWDGQPIQIKYRDTGRDILYELIKPYQVGMPLKDQSKGRDYRGKAAFYVVLSQDGKTIYKVPTAHLKALMHQVIRELDQRMGMKPLNMASTSTGIEVRVVSDPGDGTPKINAFIPPEVFDGLSQKFPIQ